MRSGIRGAAGRQLAGLTIAVALVALLISPVPSRAQAPEPEPETKPSPEAEELPGLSRLLDQAEAMEARLAELDVALSDEPQDADVDELTAEVEREAAKTRERLADGIDRVDLDASIQRWDDLARRVASAKSDVERTISELEKARQDLREASQSWSGLEEVERRDLPPEVLKPALTRIRDVRARVQARVRDLTQRLEPQVREQAQLAEATRAARDVLGELDEQSKAARSQLLSVDSAPIWRPNPDAPSSRKAIADAMARIRADFEELWTRNAARLPFHALLVTALLAAAGVVWFRRRGSAPDPTPSAESGSAKARDATRLADRPFSAALVVGLLATQLIYPRVPLGVALVVGLLALVPVLRFATHLVGPPLDRFLWFLGALFVGHRVSLLLGAESWWGRVVLLGCGVATLTVFTLVLRSSARRDLATRSRVAVFASALLPIFQLLVLTGIVAQVSGLASLAALLIGGSLLSVYAAVALATVVMIARLAFRFVAGSWIGQQLRSLRLHGDRVELELSRWLRLAAFLGWVALALAQFDVAEPVFEWVLGVLRAEIEFGSASFRLLDLILLIVTLWLSLQVARLVRFVLEEEVLPPLPLARGVPTAISRGVGYFVLALGFLFAVASAGIDVNQLTVVFGAFGVGIGFGLQNLVNNFVSGLILIFERPIQVGDLIEFQNQMGHVQTIGIRASVVRTFSGAELIVPNGDLVSSQVVNWNLSDRKRRVEIPVVLAANYDPKDAIAMMIEVARAHDNIIDEPSPTVTAKGFDEGGATVLELWCWTADTSITIATKSELTLAMVDRFREAGVRLAVPRRALRWEGDADAEAPPATREATDEA